MFISYNERGDFVNYSFNNMYRSYPFSGGSIYPNNVKNYYGNQDERLIGSGFVFPFLLGGVTGAAIAPAFWRPPYNRPFYGPYYGPYPYRPF